MIKRIAATEARLTAQIAAHQAAEIQARADEQTKITNKLWNNQQKKILCAAVDGHLCVTLTNSLARGRQLENAGFAVTEIVANISEKQLRTSTKSEEFLASVLETNIANFVFSSKHNFRDEVAYEKYIRDRFKYFLARAERIQDTKDDTALLSFLNSESYGALRCDGGWNEFLSPLVVINRIMHKIVTGLPTDRDKRMEQIRELLPSTSVRHTRIKNELLVTKHSRSYFQVTWESPPRSTTRSESLLSADRMAWLASKKGQGLMNLLFGRIQNAVVMGAQSVELSYLTHGTRWSLEGYTNIDIIAIEQLKEILGAKGYRMKLGRDQATITVAW